MAFYIISYDIKNDKARLKLFKLLKDYGTHVQYSVFEATLKKKQFDKMLSEIAKIKIDKKCDYEKAVRLLNRFMENKPEFTAGYEKLSYIYSKMGLTGLAEKMKEYVLDTKNGDYDYDINGDLKIIDSVLNVSESNFSAANTNNADNNIEFNKDAAGILKLLVPKFLSLFTGSDNFYAICAVNQEGKVFYSKVESPLNEEAVISHINGKSTAGEYIIRNDNCINFAVLDIDIASEYIKNISINSGIYSDYLNEAFYYGLFIKNTLKEKTGSECYIEFSGYKGYHVWFFFEKPVQAKNGREFLNYLVNEHRFRPHINVEIFPKENKLNPNAVGSLIKLPLGINIYTGKETYFVNDTGNKILNQFKFLMEDIIRIPESSVNNILNRQNTSFGMPVSLNRDETDEFRILLDKCQVLKYLYDKARVTKYLTHCGKVKYFILYRAY